MNKTVQLTIVAASLIGLAACSSSKKEDLDYKSTVKSEKTRLDVPPDLTDPNQGNRYVIPAGTGAVRASDVNRANGQKVTKADQKVLEQINNMRMTSDGTQRWLVIDGVNAQEIWPQLKVFWQEMGFTVGSEEPGIGFMETDWAENRAKLPNDGFRFLLEKVGLGSVYSTSERDKFISRMERTDKGIRVSFVHKGMEEVYTSRSKDNTVWQPRPSDPNLEAAFLGRFMQRFGSSEDAIKQQLDSTKTAAASEFATIDGQSVIVKGDAERNWRRVGLALDRAGLTVRQVEPSQRIYIVQPTSAESEAVSNEKPGLFKRVFSRKKKEVVTARDSLVVKLIPVQGGDRLVILDRQAAPYQGSDLNQYLSRLQTELR